MSTSTIPLLFRNGFFPGSYPFSTTALSTFNYIDLTSIDGDYGLREAYRIWWQLEQFTFVPNGTVTINGTSRSFSKQFRAPDSLDTESSVICDVSGSISASQTSIGAVSPKEPAFRAGLSNGQFISLVCQYKQVWVYDANDAESAEIKLHIIYVSGQWRLYYSFYFEVQTTGTGLQIGTLYITNPLISSEPAVNTGTFSFLGYSLDWKSFSNGSGASISGESLSASSVEWTF